MDSSQRYTPSLFQLLGVGFVAIVLVLYLAISLGTQDLLWFWPSFDAQPETILVHCYGETIQVEPETEANAKLVERLQQGLWGWKRWTDLSLSLATLQIYRYGDDSLVLEFIYVAPFRIHSQYRFFSHVDALIVPLDGRHAGAYPVFGLSDGDPMAGALHLKTNVPLLEAVREHDLCSPRNDP